MTIAIIGATGYIGKSLTHQFLTKGDFDLMLFVRSEDKIKNFLSSIEIKKTPQVYLMDQFNNFEYDVVINCAGIGNSATLAKDPRKIFEVTEDVDNLVIGYLYKNPGTLYINLSSGAVYKKNFDKLSYDEILKTSVDSLQPEDYYSFAKIKSEKSHRQLKDFNIVDIRVFSFFSRFFDQDSKFLMSEIVKSLKEKTVFLTSREDIVRDYLVSDDLFSFIGNVIAKRKVNDFFDVYSKSPVSKFELLETLHQTHNLQYDFKDDLNINSPTGNKGQYYSSDRKASLLLGYEPKLTSIDGVLSELNEIKGLI